MPRRALRGRRTAVCALASVCVAALAGCGGSPATRVTADPPQAPTSRQEGTNVLDGLTEVAGRDEASSDPTGPTSSHRVAVTESGRQFVVHGLHRTGVQLAWRDPDGPWRNATTGDDAFGLVLDEAGTGDWTASVATASLDGVGERAWVVWSPPDLSRSNQAGIRAIDGTERSSIPMLHPAVPLDPGSDRVGAADLAPVRDPAGSDHVAVSWTRSRDGRSEVVTAWIDDLASTSPALSRTSPLPDSGSARHPTLVAGPGVLSVVARSSGGDLLVWDQTWDDDASWTKREPVPAGVTGSPSAVWLGEDLLVAVNVDGGSSVWRLGPGQSGSRALTLLGYSDATITASEDTAVLVVVRDDDGFVVSRELLADGQWSDSDRVEIGPIGGGGHSDPNALRELGDRLRFIVRGPSDIDGRASVLALQRPVDEG